MSASRKRPGRGLPWWAAAVLGCAAGALFLCLFWARPGQGQQAGPESAPRPPQRPLRRSSPARRSRWRRTSPWILCPLSRDSPGSRWGTACPPSRQRTGRAGPVRRGLCLRGDGDHAPGRPGDIWMVHPSGWQSVEYDFVDGGSLYNRCHLIGFQLTGENGKEQDLVTGTREMLIVQGYTRCGRTIHSRKAAGRLCPASPEAGPFDALSSKARSLHNIPALAQTSDSSPNASAARF